MASVDNIYAMVGVFATLVVVVTVIMAWNNIKDLPLWQTSEFTQDIQNVGNTTINTMDGWLVFFFFAVHLAVILLAWALRTHPIVYVVGIIFAVLVVMISVPLSNSWQGLSEDTGEVGTAISTLPKMNFIMSHLPIIEVLISFLTIIIISGLAKSEGVI